MSKRIEFELSDKQYIIEFDRASVKKLEQLGALDSNKATATPVTAMNTIFYCSLLKHQPNMTQGLAEKLLYDFGAEYDIEDLFATLISMVEETLPNSGKDKDKKKAFTVIG